MLRSRIHKLSAGEAMYVAACIDTDGSVGVYRNKKYFECKVVIYNTHLGFLEHIQRMAGGGHIVCCSYRKFEPKQNKEYSLYFRVREMRILLPQVIPFLVIKQDGALEALTVLENRR